MRTLVARRTAGSLGSCSKLLSHRPRNISNRPFECKRKVAKSQKKVRTAGGPPQAKKVSGTKQEASTCPFMSVVFTRTGRPLNALNASSH